MTTALGASRVWVTLGHGIVNELYWPWTGEPQIRDLGFIVAARDDWFEVKRVCRYSLSLPEPLVPPPRRARRSGLPAASRSAARSAARRAADRVSPRV